MTKLENIGQRLLGEENNLQAPRTVRVSRWNSDGMSAGTVLSPRTAWKRC